MIEPAGIDCDLVPTMDRIEGVFRGLNDRGIFLRTEKWPEEIAKTGRVCAVSERKTKSEEKGGVQFHIRGFVCHDPERARAAKRLPFSTEKLNCNRLNRAI